MTSTDQKDLFDGAPVGLQVMGMRHEEEKVFGLMEAISEALEEFEKASPNSGLERSVRSVQACGPDS